MMTQGRRGSPPETASADGSSLRRSLVLWGLVVPAVLAVAWLAWAWRPLAAQDTDAGQLPPERRPVLVEVSSAGALVSEPTGTRSRVAGWSSAGTRLWTSAALSDRIAITCTPGCRGAYGSGTDASFQRPEIADPAVLAVGTGTAATPLSRGPRARVIWAGDPSATIVVSAATLGTVTTVASVDGSRRKPLAQDVRGDVRALIDGTWGALLTKPRADQTAVVFIHREDRDGTGPWVRQGAPVVLPEYSGGCFAIVDARPVAVVYSERGATVVTPAGHRPLPASAETGACAISSVGPVLARFGANGGQTTVSQRDHAGRQLWSTLLDGTREISARPTHPVVSAQDGPSRSVIFIGDRGRRLSEATAVDAELLDNKVVLLGQDGVPTWKPLP